MITRYYIFNSASNRFRTWDGKWGGFAAAQDFTDGEKAKAIVRQLATAYIFVFELVEVAL